MRKTREAARLIYVGALAFTPMLLSFPVHAEEVQRFVHPKQTTTYLEPQSKSTLRVVIDEQLGGTKDVSVAELVKIGRASCRERV